MAAEPSDLSVTQMLVVRAEQGEDLAFTELYERHCARVRHSAASRLGGYDVPDLEDIVQETFLYAFDVIRDGRFDGTQTDGGFRHWLSKVAVNKARDGLRRQRTKSRGGGREQLMRDALSRSSAELFAPSPLARPSQILEGKEFEAMISGVLNEMDERNREIIDLRDHCGLTFAEIAAEMGGTAATLRSLYKRAKDLLRELLKSRGVEPT